MKRLLLFLLCLGLLSCSRKSERELLTEAKAAVGQKNFQVAIERYAEVVDRFRTSPAAETSQYAIAVIYNNDLHDHLNAVKSYQRFFTLFPQSNEAPVAMFLTGFLFNNELHRLDSARAAYELFLQTYPNHTLASSAKFELETLGKDPGQYLHEGVTAADAMKEKKTTKQ